METYWLKETTLLGEKSVPVSLSPLQIPCRLAWNQNLDSKVLIITPHAYWSQAHNSTAVLELFKKYYNILVISNQAGMSTVLQTLCICAGVSLTWSLKKTVKFQSLFVHSKKRTFCKFREEDKLTLCIILSIFKLHGELSFYIKTQICGKSTKAEILNLVAKRKFYKYPWVNRQWVSSPSLVNKHNHRRTYN